MLQDKRSLDTAKLGPVTEASIPIRSAPDTCAVCSSSAECEGCSEPRLHFLEEEEAEEASPFSTDSEEDEEEEETYG